MFVTSFGYINDVHLYVTLFGYICVSLNINILFVCIMLVLRPSSTCIFVHILLSYELQNILEWVLIFPLGGYLNLRIEVFPFPCSEVIFPISALWFWNQTCSMHIACLVVFQFELCVCTFFLLFMLICAYIYGISRVFWLSDL